MGPNFDTEISRSKDAIIVAVIGELDLTTAPWLDDQLSLALASNARQVIVELERVTFIDAHGLRLLVRHARSREHGERVAMKSLSFPVQRMLALTGVDVS